MHTIESFEHDLYQINATSFEKIALDVFAFQSVHNRLYANYLTHLGVASGDIKAVSDIPFLPISFFKTHDVKTGDWTAEAEFKSSGTTGANTSKHLVRSIKEYHQNAIRIFELFYGSLRQFHILALLPSYLDREGSSLVSMVNHFVEVSGSDQSGFFLNQFSELAAKTEKLAKGDRKILLIGVSFALLDFAEKFELDLSDCILMETGGMKGRRAEITREELHSYLKSRLNTPSVHSEYGMTELLSQAYSRNLGYFRSAPWMKVVVRDINDPFSIVESGRAGVLNIVDLANWHTCSFIETQDLGRVHQDGSFEVLGRVDNSDRRGCNLLVE